MNITRLNTLNDDKVIIRGNGGNGGGCEEYDPLSKDMIYLDLSTFSLDDKTSFCSGITVFAKYIDDNGETKFVPPFAYAGNDIGRWGRMNYYAVCGSLLVHGDNGDIPIKDAINLYFGDIPRITKEEFYHIPQDEVWPLNTQEDYKTAWDKLYPLVERYGADYINENGLSLAPWYKSLTIGDNIVTELSWYSLAEDGDSKRERISFTQYTGIEKYTYTDGTIEYQSYNPPV